MEITLTTRLGGPELDLAPVVRLRRELKRAFGPWAVEALETVDLALTVGGSVTSAEGAAGVHDLRYSAARRRLTANLIVEASAVTAHGGDILAATRTVFLALSAAVGARLRRQTAEYDERGFTDRVEAALAAAVSGRL